MSYQIKVILPFEKAVRSLSKKYRRIKQDLEAVSLSLEKCPTIGVAIPGYEGAIWKYVLVPHMIKSPSDF